MKEDKTSNPAGRLATDEKGKITGTERSPNYGTSSDGGKHGTLIITCKREAGDS